MIVIPKRQIWTRQPTEPQRVAWKNPITAGLRGAWHGGPNMINAVSGRPIAAFGNPDYTRISGSHLGVATEFYGADTTTGISAIDTGEVIDFAGSHAITIYCGFYPTSTSGARIFGAHLASTYGYLAALESGSFNAYLNASQIPGPAVVKNEWNHAAIAVGDGVKRLSINGVVTSTSESERTVSSSGLSVYIGAYDWLGYKDFRGKIAYAFLWSRALEDHELKSIFQNPWQVYAKRGALIFLPAAGGGTSAELAGSAISTATGSLSASISCGITGQSATTSAGTLTPESAVYEAAITGSAATTATGAAAPAISKALTGSAATTATGAAAPEISKALAGSAATTATGAAAPAISKALTGSAATTATGAASPAISKALTGSAATTATGALTPDGAISGTGVTTSTGALSPALSKAVEGQAATTAVGTLSVTLSSALAGVASVTSAGSLSAQTADIVLSGQQTTTATGALAASLTTTLSGSSATADSGTLTVVQNPVEGLQVTTAVGLLAASLSLSLSGRQVTASVGYLDSGAPTFREIVYLKSGIHPSVTLSSPLSG